MTTDGFFGRELVFLIDITLIDNKQNFLVLSGGVVIPCWFDPNTNKIKNSAGTQVTTGYVIGYAIVSSGSVTDSEAYHNAISISQQIDSQSAFILGMLAEAGEAGFADVAEAMGISNAFTSLASYNAFIVNLKAVNVTAGYGNGSTGGFRFRAMSDRDMDGGNIPVFDVMYNLLLSGDPYREDLFRYTLWYDPADGKIHTPNDKTIIKQTVPSRQYRWGFSTYRRPSDFCGIYLLMNIDKSKCF